MIELQNSIQDRIPATRYKASHKSLVGRDSVTPTWGAQGIQMFLNKPPHTHTHT